MVNIVVKFKRVAEAFDDMARDGRRLCESSGSEHSAAESFTDLSYLVNSFLERGTNDDVFSVNDDDEEEGNENGNNDNGDGDNNEGGVQVQRSKVSESGVGVEEALMTLFRIEDGHVKMKIHAEVEQACLKLGGFELGSKRQLVALLRERGLDARLCKSKWDKKGHCPPGVYEYIDVIVEGARYIVEVSLASEFEIARQTRHYASLLQLFPTIFVGEVRKVKKLVRLMCNSIKMSMKKDHIHVPPWRRLDYMQAKWLGPYRRTINEVPTTSKPIDTDLATMRSIGFMAAPLEASGFMVAPPAISGYCREDFASRNFVRRVGNLTAAFTSSPILL